MPVISLRVPAKPKGLRCGKVNRPVQPLFSPRDADLAKFRWHADCKGYARHSERVKKNGKVGCKAYRAHRVVMSRKLNRDLLPTELVDHKNRNKLDCRRSNLLLVTTKQSSQNRGVQKNNLAGIRGVIQIVKNGRWRARVRHDGKLYHCGYFATAAEAGKAASLKRRSLGFHGEFNHAIR